jgi:hypothetical protein
MLPSRQERLRPPTRAQRRRPSPVPTLEEIAVRAFALFMMNERRVSRRDCWCSAEAQLLDGSARRLRR